MVIMKKPIFRYRNLQPGYHDPTRDAITFVLNKFCPRMADRVMVRVRGDDRLLEKHNEYAYNFKSGKELTERLIKP